MSNTDSLTVTLRQQIGSLPANILTAWRGRYVADDGVDLEARAILEQEATALRAREVQPEALLVWMRLADAIGRAGTPSRELTAAAALAGLAAEVRPQGFDAPRPADAEVVQRAARGIRTGLAWVVTADFDRRAKSPELLVANTLEKVHGMLPAGLTRQDRIELMAPNVLETQD